MPGRNVISPTRRRKEIENLPCVLDDEAQIILPSKFDSFLDIFRTSGIDADHRHVPLFTREAERGVEVTALNRPVGKSVRLVVGVFGSTRLIRTPYSVEPASLDIGAVSCRGIVARGGRRDRMDQWLRDF